MKKQMYLMSAAEFMNEYYSVMYEKSYRIYPQDFYPEFQIQ